MDDDALADLCRRNLTMIALGETPRTREARIAFEELLKRLGLPLVSVDDAATNHGLHVTDT